MTDITTDERAPEQAGEAETAALGAMMHSPRALARARVDLTVDAFYNPFHATVFATICDLADQDLIPDAQAVVTELARTKHLGTDGARTLAVFDMWANTYHVENIAYHARQVRHAARVRSLTQEHARLGQALDEAAKSGDIDTLLDIAAQQALAIELLADQPDTDAPIEGLSTWKEFTETQAGSERWVVPDLIGKLDTILILAAPGAGKSFLSRQVCTSLAAGLHPFTLDRIEPVRTLLVDLENAPGQVADETVPLLGQIHRLVGSLDDRGWVWMRPEGLDLRRREDANLFERVIVETRPQVVAFGSLYNAYRRGSDGWDVAAEEVQAVLKRIRARYDVSFWVEHHMVRAQGGSGHTGTPFGGTSWEKWPTHGRVLRKASDNIPVYLLEAGTFRSDRGQRPGIPIAVRRGGRLPLTAIFDAAELDIELEAAAS